MRNPSEFHASPDLARFLQPLMLLRVLLVSLFLGALILLQIRQRQTYFGPVLSLHYLLIASVYLLSLLYVLLYRHYRNDRRFAYGQLLGDTLFITVLIYATGGIDSIFSFLYILIIITASILLLRKGSLIVASASGILYGALLDLHFYGILHPAGGRIGPLGETEAPFILYKILVTTAAFYLVAYLSGYLSETLRQSRVELQSRQADLDTLEVLNQTIVASIGQCLVATDPSERIILFNPAAEATFEFPRWKVLGMPLLEILPFLKDHQTALQPAPQGTLGYRTLILDIPWNAPPKPARFLRVTVSPLPLASPGPQGRIYLFQDMTEIRRIEEEKKHVEGLALMGEVAAAMAHEIRNPLASISGSIQMLKGSLPPDPINDRLMEITLREITRLESLVKDFLLFARPRKAAMKTFFLDRLIQDTLTLFVNSLPPPKRTKVEFDMPENIPITSDPEQLKQVFWNLFLNAAEAMAGEGSLGIAAHPPSAPDQYGSSFIHVTVMDSGPGFSKEALARIFTPFFTTREGGSGLGLATVRRIVEGLGGTVSGENSLDGSKGAIIHVRLPVAPGNEPPRPYFFVRNTHPGMV